MLAYVFWHWPHERIAVGDYEARLADFHRALAENPPPGFGGSWSYGIAGAGWAAGGAAAYEDWYAVDDWGDLGALNEVAVTAARRPPHDAVAQQADNGTAGIYRLRHGSPKPEARLAYWFDKPQGMSYAALDEVLQPHLSNTVVLWQRQMTLGPAREFCLHAPAPLDLPAPIVGLAVKVRPVYPDVVLIEGDGLRLRRTTTADLDRVIAAENDADNRAFVGQWTHDQHSVALSDPTIAHLIIERAHDNSHVGHSIITDTDSPTVYLKRIVITDKSKGYGHVALRLVKRLVFEGWSAHKLWLDVKDFNARARHLYRAEGFVEEGILRDHLKTADGYESLVVMAILRDGYMKEKL